MERNFNWKKTLSLPFNIEKDTNLRWLQVRIIHRILGTNHLLHRMGMKQNDKCSFCGEEKETIKHLFWDCEYVEYFWSTLLLLLVDNCGFVNIVLTDVDVLLGNPKFDGIFNKIILWGKKYIYKSKVQGVLPAFTGFQRFMSWHYKIERYIAKVTHKFDVFQIKWEKYGELFEE